MQNTLLSPKIPEVSFSDHIRLEVHDLVICICPKQR